MFKEVNLSASVPTDNRHIADYVTNYSFEFIVDLSKKLTDEFEIVEKLNLRKEELGLWMIQTETKQNNLRDIDKLTLKLEENAQSQYGQVKTGMGEKVIDCIAYFR